MVLITILFSSIPVTAYAFGSNGTGNSSGTFKPLGLTSITLENGENIIDSENVPLNPNFTLKFTQNVVNMLYWEQNKSCFHLYDDNDSEFALNISKIDDTVDFTKRQNIWVEPKEALSANTNFTLYISPDLVAKNGGSTLAMSTDNQGVYIKFKTMKDNDTHETKRQEPDTLSVAIKDDNVNGIGNDNNTVPEPGTLSKKSTIEQSATADPHNESDLHEDSDLPLSGSSGEKEKDNKEDQLSQPKTNYLAAIAIILILIWLGFEFKQRKNNDN